MVECDFWATAGVAIVRFLGRRAQEGHKERGPALADAGPSTRLMSEIYGGSVSALLRASRNLVSLRRSKTKSPGTKLPNATEPLAGHQRLCAEGRNQVWLSFSPLALP